ncbi:MAG: hypothetical protein ACM3VW_05035, partial [Bacteroidota bacterium]
MRHWFSSTEVQEQYKMKNMQGERRTGVNPGSIIRVRMMYVTWSSRGRTRAEVGDVISGRDLARDGLVEDNWPSEQKAGATDVAPAKVLGFGWL